MVIASFALLSSLLTASLVCATAISTTSNRKCKDFDIPVLVTAQNGIFEFPPLTNNEEAADLGFILGNRNSQPAVPSGYVNITGTYNINARFCTPIKGGDKAKIVQILTHGVGFDKSYVFYAVLCINFN